MSIPLFYSTTILRRSFWRFAVTASLPLVLGLVSTSASMAQPVFGRGNGASNFTPTFLPNSETFGLDPGVRCPTPSFNMTGFAGTANDFANASSDLRASSNSGLNNYGVTVGINVPFGGKLGDFCKDFAASRTAFERKRVEIQQINAQLALIQRCITLDQMGFDFDNEAFYNNEQFAALHPCRSLNPLLVNLKPMQPKEETSDKGEGIPDEPERFSPEPTITVPTE